MAAAAYGMREGAGRLAEAGGRVAAQLDPSAAVDMKTAEVQVKASARVARSIDESLGTLIDDLA